jgi:hypothetical protein
MATGRADYPIEPTDFADMRANGVRSLALRCHECQHERIMDVDHLPERLIVLSFGRRMVCIYCGMIGSDVRPNWKACKKQNPPHEGGALFQYSPLSLFGLNVGERVPVSVPAWMVPQG